MTRTQVLLVAGLVLAPLVSVFLRAVMAYLERNRPRVLDPGEPSVPAPRHSVPAPAPSAHARDILRGRVAAAVTATGATPERRGRHRDVRQGLVLMAILGPCRALSSPDA
jgi:hypothetical protein